MIQTLNDVIEKYNLLNHPFYQAWSAGELSLETLKHYASEYYAQVSTFPRFLSKVHSNCPEIEARKVLLRNLVDEEIHGDDHPALWMKFAKGLGTIPKDAELAQTHTMVNTYFDLANSHWTDGLCALYAYESQVPAVSASKIDGLKKHYGINDADTLEFFTAHQEYDVEHSNQVASLIEKYADSDRAVKATEKAAKALWQFLDGMCEHHNIKCEVM